MHIPAGKEYSEGILTLVDSDVFSEFGGTGYLALQYYKKNYARVKFDDEDKLKEFAEKWQNEPKCYDEYSRRCIFDFWFFKMCGVWYSVNATEGSDIEIVAINKSSSVLNFACYIEVNLDTRKFDFISAQGVFCQNYDEFQRHRDLKYREIDKKLVKGFFEYWEKGAEKERSDAFWHLNNVLIALTYINYEIEQQRQWKQLLKEEADTNAQEGEIKPLTEKTSNSTKDNKRPYKRGVISIGGLSITVPKGSGITKTKIMHRHAEVWGVRGHYRCYKSGKKVWIEPYKKGKKRNELEPINRSYLIK